MKEREIIESLREVFPDAGIGDDAAIIPTGGGELLLAADAVIEGVHFRRDFSTIRQAVEKVITSNVADIYAMGGEPGSVLLTAGFPKGFTEQELAEVTEGLESACGTYGLRLAGGDTVLSPRAIFFNVAILGSVDTGCAVCRSGAREGDLLVLFGECGRSLAGLRILTGLADGGAGIPGPKELVGDAQAREALLALLPELTTATEPEEIALLCEEAGLSPALVPAVILIKHHLTPLARPLPPPVLERGAPAATAMIDVSDGLARDIRSLCAESGVGAAVEEAALPVPAEITAVFGDNGALHRELVLASGEEYVMLAAVRDGEHRASLPGGTVIGSITAAADGIVLEARDGGRESLPELGYEHLF